MPRVKLMGAMTKMIVGIMNAAMRYIHHVGRKTSRNVVIHLFDHCFWTNLDTWPKQLKFSSLLRTFPVTLILVMPELIGRLDGLSIRVPTPNVSLVDLTFTSERPTSREAINAALKAGALQLPPGVMECNELALVSSDFNGYPVSCVVDLSHTRVQGDLVKVLAWYDNEWAFANRMLDVMLAWVKPEVR